MTRTAIPPQGWPRAAHPSPASRRRRQANGDSPPTGKSRSSRRLLRRFLPLGLEANLFDPVRHESHHLGIDPHRKPRLVVLVDVLLNVLVAGDDHPRSLAEVIH